MANGDKARLYLNTVITIALVLLALVAWSMQDALARNDKDHEVIKDDLRELASIVMTYVKNAPPNHIHMDDEGHVARVIPDN